MKQRLDGLAVFRELLKDGAVAAFRELLQDCCRNDADNFVSHCGEFESLLFQQSDCWTAYLRRAVMESENVCIRNWASGAVTAVQEECLNRELVFLDRLSQVTLDDLTAGLDHAPDFLVGWRTEGGSIAQDYRQRMQEVGEKGYGIFARYHMFTVENGQLVPVKHPDPQQLEQLPGYEQERQKVIANTQALLDGIDEHGEISEAAKDEVRAQLRRSFRPEFLNRLDEIVFYKPLTKENITGIIDLQIAALNKRLEDKQLHCELTPEAKQFIIDAAYDPQFGARPLRRYVQHTVETLLAKRILRGDVIPGQPLTCGVENGELFIR